MYTGIVYSHFFLSMWHVVLDNRFLYKTERAEKWHGNVFKNCFFVIIYFFLLFSFKNVHVHFLLLKKDNQTMAFHNLRFSMTERGQNFFQKKKKIQMMKSSRSLISLSKRKLVEYWIIITYPTLASLSPNKFN